MTKLTKEIDVKGINSDLMLLRLRGSVIIGRTLAVRSDREGWPAAVYTLAFD